MTVCDYFLFRFFQNWLFSFFCGPGLRSGLCSRTLVSSRTLQDE